MQCLICTTAPLPDAFNPFAGSNRRAGTLGRRVVRGNSHVRRNDSPVPNTATDTGQRAALWAVQGNTTAAGLLLLWQSTQVPMVPVCLLVGQLLSSLSASSSYPVSMVQQCRRYMSVCRTQGSLNLPAETLCFLTSCHCCACSRAGCTFRRHRGHASSNQRLQPFQGHRQKIGREGHSA